MKLKTTLALLPLTLLAACGGDKQTVDKPLKPALTTYSYPADGQQSVSPKTDVVLRFSHAITDNKAAEKISLTNDEGAVDFKLTPVDGGRSLKLTPTEPLAPNSRYSVEFVEDLRAVGDRAVSNPNSKHDDEPGIQFQTRGAFGGSAGLANSSTDFKLTNMVPETGSEFEPVNFSAFRLTLSHPVHPQWRAKGGTIELLDQDDIAVPATVLVKGNRITLDPCVTPDPKDCGSKDDVLNAGENYKLAISELPSLTADEQTFSDTYEFTPRNTGPTVVLQQSAIDSGIANGISEEGATKSILNGQPINGVTLNSVLLGTTDTSQQGGDLLAELAFTPSFKEDEAIPLRIPKGSVLSSTSLDVNIGGTVPVLDAATGEPQTTGTINVTMLADASGYLSPNPYTDDINAPRQITLFMDISMSAEEAQPNASLSQDLLGVELRGIALVKDGVLTIDAIGMVEPDLLGQEFSDSTIAFHLQAATDADSALDAEQLRDTDETPPRLVSWTPGKKDEEVRQSIQRPGDPVILFFDEPLDPDSIAEGAFVYADGQKLTVGDGLNAELDGTALTLNPTGGLKPGIKYTVSASEVTDLAGNKADIEQLDFRLDGKSIPGKEAPPLALTTYPGFPCETDHSTLDLKSGTLGHCNTKGENSGDLLPVSEMPGDRPITVVFSQPMNLDSIRLGITFIVQKVDAEDGTDIEQVSGRLEKNNQRIRFYPDQPWEKGKFYQYTMEAHRTDTSCTQEETTAICGANDLPLKPDLLRGLDLDDSDESEHALKIYFKAVATQDSVPTPLRNLPVRDANANLAIDCASDDEGADCLEPFNHQKEGNGSYRPSANAAKLLVAASSPNEARVGCAPGDNQEDCPKDKFIHLTYALTAEVTGSKFDAESGKEGLGILLHPTLLATTSQDVHVVLLGLDAVATTGPQVLRMRYAKDDPDCDDKTGTCPRNSLVPGIIVENDHGEPILKVTAELYIDAPDLTAVANIEGTEVPASLVHNLVNYPLELELTGKVAFFDDGRMQIEARNQNVAEINVEATALEAIPADIPLVIPKEGLFLNFVSNPIKDLPMQR